MAAKASTEQRPPMNADQTPGDQTVPHTKSPPSKQAAKRRTRVTITKGGGKGSALKVQVVPAIEDAEAAAVGIIPSSDTAE